MRPQESCRFNLACFSAGSRDYVSQILQHLDPQGTIFKGAVYSRGESIIKKPWTDAFYARRAPAEQCSFIAELGITKDLSILCKPLSRIVLVGELSPVPFRMPCRRRRRCCWQKNSRVPDDCLANFFLHPCNGASCCRASPESALTPPL